jgi:rod shape-determining protein MreB
VPSVIATAFGFEIEKFRKSYLIVDIGINTELAVVNNGRILTGATLYNGGNNIDKKIAKYILDEKSIELSNESAEKVKNEIATLLPNDIRSIKIDGFIKDTTEYATVEVTSTDIFSLVVEEYNTIALGIKQLLSTCETEVNQDIKKHGIYLCGASSKITGIEKFLKCKLDLNSYVYKPEIVTMIGAGQLLDDPQALNRIVLENV